MAKPEPKYPITLKISGRDNIRDIQLKAERLLREHGVPKNEITEFWTEITEKTDYNYVFDVCHKYFFVG